ncbi:MAG TPA: Rieske 2Fe-2S domain-containing protein, partial [Sporichthya sp.]|nr:Rieske 2Fe-2S domain-containing protein [Sporichthya sp.]
MSGARGVQSTDQIRWLGAVELEDFWEGELIDVEVDGEKIMLAHLAENEIKAFQGVCPHQEVLLALGVWDPDSRILVCTGHNWEFDLNSGSGRNPAEAQLYEYPVRVVHGVEEVGIP